MYLGVVFMNKVVIDEWLARDHIRLIGPKLAKNINVVRKLRQLN